MRRLSAVLLVFLLSVSLLGCGKEHEEETRKNNTRRTTEADDRNGEVKPGTEDPTKEAKPSESDGSGKEFQIVVTWANWKSFIEFYKVEDRSRVNASEKVVEYTFGVRAKEGFELRSLSIQLDATLYYRRGNADMGEHLEKNITVTMDEPTYTIRFTADDLINYTCRIVESVSYDDMIAVNARVVKK